MGKTEMIYIDAAKRALERAYADNVHQGLSAIESDDSGAVAIYHKGEAYYVVTLAGCSCKGSQRGYLCKHQIALADVTGNLDKFIPAVYPPVMDADVEAARADVERLARNPKSTADWHALQNARARLAELAA